MTQQMKLLKDENALEEFASRLTSDERRGATVLQKAALRSAEDLRLEKERLRLLFENRLALFEKGYQLVAGVDEVGMGPLAGPVVAAAVILPDEVNLSGLNDSKVLSSRRREELAEKIQNATVYLDCWMTASKIKEMKSKKTLFPNVGSD